MTDVRGMIAVDKIGCKILFLNPQSYETETVLEGFERAPEGLIGLFEGRNIGKMLIHIAD